MGGQLDSDPPKSRLQRLGNAPLIQVLLKLGLRGRTGRCHPRRTPHRAGRRRPDGRVRRDRYRACTRPNCCRRRRCWWCSCRRIPDSAARPGRPDHERDLAADLAMDSLPTKDQAVVPRGPIQGHGDSERGRPTAAVAGGIGRDRVAGSQQAVPGPHDLPSRSQTCDLRRVPGQVGGNVKADPISGGDTQSIRIPLDKEPGSARLRQNGRHGSLPPSSRD